MFKGKIIKITEQNLVNIIKTNEEGLRRANEQAFEYCSNMHKYHEQLRIEQAENNHLVRENEQLRMLFDKEADTQVIKYNGKLYRIVSTSHFRNAGEADTLDINAVCVDKVG